MDRKILNNSLSTDESEKEFFKINKNVNLATNGFSAHVIFMNNKPNRKSKSEAREDDLITDGGIKEKERKYYNSTKFNNFLTTNKTKISSSPNEISEFKNYSVNVSVNNSISSDTHEIKNTKIIISKDICSKKAKTDDKIDEKKKEMKINNFIGDKKKNKEIKEKQRDYSADIRKVNIKKEISVKANQSKISQSSDKSNECQQQSIKLEKKSDDSLKLSKRKSFNVPVPKPSKPKLFPEPEIKILTEDEKAENIGKLIRNYEDVLKSDVRKEVTNKSMKIQDKLKKKLQYVDADAIIENLCQDECINENSNVIMENNEKDSNRKEEENNIIMNDKRGRSIYFNNEHRSKSMPKKPKIDTFEIINLIKNEKKKLNCEVNNKQDKDLSSFRKSNSVSKSTNQYILDNKEEYPYVYKQNVRERSEVINFINYKKQVKKEEAIRLEQEILENNLKKLAELARVNEVQKYMIEQSAYANRKSGKFANKSNSANKIKNTYFIGKKKFIINSDKDKEAYYKAYFEKQKLFRIQSHKPIGKRPEWDPCIEKKKKFKPKKFKKQLNLNDKEVIQGQTKEAFIKFLDEVKQTTLRSLDSHDLLSVKSNVKSSGREVKLDISKSLERAKSLMENPFKKSESDLNSAKFKSERNDDNYIFSDIDHVNLKSNEENNQISKSLTRSLRNSLSNSKLSQDLEFKENEINMNNLIKDETISKNSIDKDNHVEIYNSDKIEESINPYKNYECLNHLTRLITLIVNRRSLVDIYINVEIAELEARIEFLMSAITHNFKYNCFSEIYNYGIVMEEYNQKIAEMFNEALYGIDNIFNKYESDNIKYAFDLLKNNNIEKYESNDEFSIRKTQKSEKSFDQKCYSFVYENLSSRNSSIHLHPNSVDSPKLSRLMQLVNRQKTERSYKEEISKSDLYDINLGIADDNSKCVNYSKISNIEENNTSNNKISPSLRIQNRSFDINARINLSTENDKSKIIDYQELSKIDYPSQDNSKLNNIEYKVHDNNKSFEKSFKHNDKSIIEKSNNKSIIENSIDKSPILDKTADNFRFREKSIDKATILDKSIEKSPILDESIDKATILEKSIEKSPILDKSKDKATILEKSIDKSYNKIYDSLEKSKTVEYEQELIDQIEEDIDIDTIEKNKINSQFKTLDDFIISEERTLSEDKNKNPFIKQKETIEEIKMIFTEPDVSAEKYNGSLIEWQSISNSSNKEIKVEEKSINVSECKYDDFEDIEYEPEDILKIIHEDNHDQNNIINKSRNIEAKMNEEMVYNNIKPNEHVIFDENNLHLITKDKVTIESEKKNTIESEEKFFDIKNNNAYKVHNLLDDKSSVDRILNSISIISPSNTSTINCPNRDNITTLEIKKDIDIISIEDKLELLDFDEVANDITELIMKDLLNSEIITSNNPLIKKKTFKSEIIQNNSFINENSYTSNVSLNNSIFMKNILEQKKETNQNLYNDEIAPRLIEKVMDQIDINYDKIREKLSSPYTYDSEELIQSIVTKDHELLRNSYRIIKNPHDKSFFEKKKILLDFETKNNKIRNDVNITSDNYYDNILNECLIDAASELIEKERIYGNLGEPLPWSTRPRICKFKHLNSDNSKKGFKDKIKNELSLELNSKMGMISENYEIYDVELINHEREKRLMSAIMKELFQHDNLWKNYEIEETQIKLELSNLVMEQLLNEVVEILEHIQLSRKKPILYQNKSIFACEEIPRLTIQDYHQSDIDRDNINQ